MYFWPFVFAVIAIVFFAAEYITKKLYVAIGLTALTIAWILQLAHPVANLYL